MGNPGPALDLKSFYQSPERLVLAKVRMIKATRPVERSYKDREDIQNLLANTKVNRRRLIAKVKSEGALDTILDILEKGVPRTARNRVRNSRES